MPNPNVIMAVGTNDVFSDIMNGPRYKGAVSALKGVTAAMDTIFITFISICAFFIISAALLKNVIAGVYASYPKLFDTIHEVKLAAINKVQGINTIGSFGSALLKLIPDIKVMSEFADDNIQPRDYFIKAIPQMICAVMIGVVIYNGYYRDIVVKFAEFGSTMIERVLFRVDPVQVFDNLTNSFGTPKLASDVSDDSKSELISKITKKMYANTISFYTDIVTADAKTQLAASMEQWVTAQINSCASYTDDTKYKASFQVDKVLGDIDVSTVNKTADEEVVRAWVVPYSQFNINSGEHLNEDWRMRVIVKFSKVHGKVSSTGTVAAGQLQVPNSYKTTPTGRTDYDLIKMSTNELKGLVAGNSFKIGGISAEIDKTQGIIVYGHLSDAGLYDVSDLYYSDSKSPSNMITSLKIGGDSVQYVDTSNESVRWAPGEVAGTAEEKVESGGSTN